MEVKIKKILSIFQTICSKSDFLRYLWPFWGTTHCVVTTKYSENASQDKIDMIFKFLDI